MLAKVLGRQVRPLHLADEETEAAKQRGGSRKQSESTTPRTRHGDPAGAGQVTRQVRPSPSLRFAVRNGGW